MLGKAHGQNRKNAIAGSCHAHTCGQTAKKFQETFASVRGSLSTVASAASSADHLDEPYLCPNVQAQRLASV